MDKQDAQERMLILRGLLGLRLGPLAPLFYMTVAFVTCDGGERAVLLSLLVLMAGLPALAYFLGRERLKHAVVPAATTAFDFLLATLLNTLSSRYGLMPLYFPLYIIVALESACWWGWPGAMISGAVGGMILSWLHSDIVKFSPELRLLMLAVMLGWPGVLGYYTQWGLRQWRERRRVGMWLSQQESLVRQVQSRLEGWAETCRALRAASSPQALLQTALHEALTSTTSPLGLVATRDPRSGVLRVECWEGFALAGPDRTILRPHEKLPSPEGAGPVEVRHVLVIPLRATSTAANNGPADLGHIVVARVNEPPYQAAEEQWLSLLAGYTAALLENRFLRGQLGQVHKETDGLATAAWTLAALPDPAAAMEMACRNVLSTLGLQQVVLFLYGEEKGPGCRVLVYPAEGPTHTTTISLQGRGLRMLRKFVDGGASLIVNRRNEWPELFDLMGWRPEEVQAVACFPLYVLDHRWGALCLLAKVPDAFPPQTQQNLTIFSGEVSMALENFYLRQVAAEVGG